MNTFLYNLPLLHANPTLSYRIRFLFVKNRYWEKLPPNRVFHHIEWNGRVFISFNGDNYESTIATEYKKMCHTSSGGCFSLKKCGTNSLIKKSRLTGFVFIHTPKTTQKPSLHVFRNGSTIPYPNSLGQMYLKFRVFCIL